MLRKGLLGLVLARRGHYGTVTAPVPSFPTLPADYGENGFYVLRQWITPPTDDDDAILPLPSVPSIPVLPLSAMLPGQLKTSEYNHNHNPHNGYSDEILGNYVLRRWLVQFDQFDQCL